MHKLTNINDTLKSADCAVCGVGVPIRRKNRGVNKGYGWRCFAQYKVHERGAYTAARGDHCEACGFIPLDLCQLDVDHKNGNHSNNRKENLWTLCSNCHRLKTHKLNLFKETYLKTT